MLIILNRSGYRFQQACPCQALGEILSKSVIKQIISLYDLAMQLLQRSSLHAATQLCRKLKYPSHALGSSYAAANGVWRSVDYSSISFVCRHLQA